MGKLSLVPTPIGNLEDITMRALRVLQECDLILCEDTRHSKKLMAHYNISKKLVSFHQHNEHKLADNLVSQMIGGAHFAMVTDAGTPGISDPGFLLVRAAIRGGVDVECLPGPVAFVPAVVASGFACEKFIYLGFPPQKKGRQTFWNSLKDEERTMVLYESPHRIAKALREAILFFGADRNACVVREISKIHETFHRNTLQLLADQAEKGDFKGELVLVIEGKLEK